MKKLLLLNVVMLGLFALLVLPLGMHAGGQSQKLKTQRNTQQQKAHLAREVRHQLVMLPYYSVFDNLSFRINDDDTVTLMGQVTRPTLKSEAANVVKGIEGVRGVTNEIEVLPLSPNDDRIRMAVYRAIYGNSALQQYALRAVPPIHIIVKNGNVTLDGVVATQMDKTLAVTQAKGVSGAFSVTDNLRVEKPQ
jgi:hyperosmotically inducible protein